MIIYLKHPTHGVKIAISDMEAQYDEQHGWERYTPGEPDANALAPRRRRKDTSDGNDRQRPD